MERQNNFWQNITREIFTERIRSSHAKARSRKDIAKKNSARLLFGWSSSVLCNEKIICHLSFAKLISSL
jgi:hypothetical protein